jgi:hypothetical protein
MSIFGKLDAAKIPASPYFIEAGEYSAVVNKAEYRNNRDGDRQLFIEYLISDEDSLFHNKRVGVFFALVDPDLTEEDFTLLPTAEQATIHRNITNLKRAMCGYGNNKGLGVTVEDLNSDDWDPAVLKGLAVNLAINNWGADNQGVNVKWANLVE